MVPLAFLGAIVVGTVLLMLPAAHVSGEANLMAAAFTTVSAVCVTGLATVDTATYWTPIGQGIILFLIQIGGFGIMSLATLVALIVRGRLGLTSTLIAQAETQTLEMGSVGHVLRRIFLSMLVAEAAIATVLTLRFSFGYGEALPTALWHGVFHAVSSFNNAGFALYSNNIVGFVSDAWICLPICLGIIAGGVGYPVFFELIKRWRRPSTWSAHTRMTVYGYTLLLVIGIACYLWFEWTNPATMGPLAWEDKVTAAIFGGVNPRTAGFNSIDLSHIRPETLVITLVLMFVGGGSAGTAGGIKVTTFFLLGHVILSEARGEEEVRIGPRRIAHETIRQALSVALLGVGVVTIGTIAMVMITDYSLDVVTFEVVSAFGTVGLSTGITPQLPVAAQLVLMVIMYVGRVGTVTTASALALHQRKRRYHLPEEHPIVG